MAMSNLISRAQRVKVNNRLVGSLQLRKSRTTATMKQLSFSTEVHLRRWIEGLMDRWVE